MIEAASGGNAPRPSVDGACGQLRTASEARCAEAQRLRAAADSHERGLRETRLQLAEAMERRQGDARVRDRRVLAEAKEAARETYRRATSHATDDHALRAAAAEWLHEIQRLNRGLLSAQRNAASAAGHVVELGAVVARAEAAYDAARVAADIAESACLEARQAVAACEEDVRRGASVAAVPALPADTRRLRTLATLVRRREAAQPALTRLLQGDHAAVTAVASQLAEATGLEAGRLQVLLVELRELAVARAIEESALAFPDDHPFWSQLYPDDSQRVVHALASMGYRFDGHRGWLDGRVPTTRDLAMALSHAGHDPRSIRRLPGPKEIEVLWHGTRLLVEEFLLARAPALDLGELTVALGPRAASLGELWDSWGALRPLLLTD